MDILLLLIPLSVVLAFLIGAGFWWGVKSGQFDDLEGPAHRILSDDDSGGVDSKGTNDGSAAGETPALTSIKAEPRGRP